MNQPVPAPFLFARRFTAALSLAAALAAQSPLATPFTGTIATTNTGVVYFDVTVHQPAGVTLTAVDLHLGSAAGTQGAITIYNAAGSYLGVMDDPSMWNVAVTAPVTSAGPGVPTRVLLGAGLFLGATTHGIAIETGALTQRVTAGAACSSNTVPGACANAAFGNADLAFAGGATAIGAFHPISAMPRIWNGALHYVVGDPAVTGTHTRYGMGSYASVYKHFTNAAAACVGLQGHSVCFVPDGAVYIATWGSEAFVPPSAAATPLFATSVNDLETTLTPSLPLPTPQGPQATLRVHSNGVLAWGASGTLFPNTSSFVPTAGGFLGANNAAIFAWHDYNETEPGSGRILREERVVGGRPMLFVTWNGVENYSVPQRVNPGTMQFQLDLQSGAVTIVWPHVDGDTTSNDGSSHLVGWSPAGPSRDPGPVDLATALPLRTANVDGGPRLASNTPRLGASWSIQVTDALPPAAPIAGIFFGMTPYAAGVDLAPLGAPGSRAYHSADLVATTVPTTNGIGTLVLAVPLSPALNGALLHAQAAALQPTNALGATTSSGLTARLGN